MTSRRRIAAGSPATETRWLASLVAAILATAGVAMLGASAGTEAPPRPPAVAGPAAGGQVAAGPVAAGAASAVPPDGRAAPGRPRPGPAAQAPVPVALGHSIPVRLDIPAIRVHTDLMRLGLNPDGTVEVPPLTAGAPAGWYEGMVSPGERGSAVLLGHVDSARDGPAVFFRLGALRRGDLVSVSRADGSTAVFTVTRSAQYPKTAFPAGAVYGPLDYPGLWLITCGGTFDRARHSYRDNIIVHAVLTSYRSGARPR